MMTSLFHYGRECPLCVDESSADKTQLLSLPLWPPGGSVDQPPQRVD